MFINNLNRIRIGDVDDYIVNYFNTRYDPYYNISKDSGVVIATSKWYKEQFNKNAMKLLDGMVYTNYASKSGDISINSTPAEKILVLKKNAKVMMVKNDSEKRWVNGTLGKVINILPDHLEVLINGKLLTINKNKWSNIEPKYDELTGELREIERGSIIQYPLAPGYAFTDKKVQGLTFSEVAIHTGRGLYDSGQAYNILSRCKTFENIHLLTKLKRSDFIVDKKVIEFMKNVDAIAD